ncbi:MAG TPA: alpha-ketoacid dehydrogenase subunit beta [Chthonomonadales bacterium]|nr:alpha-ketoacid dehydrogenase subunit beta [Chthonomonadales bacterium]
MLTIAEALRDGIREEMRRDPTVFCLGEDIGVAGGWGGAFTVTLGLADEFGHDRVLDTPISESGFCGVAIGAAMTGMRPIADVQYGDFLFCMMDQLANQAAKMTYMSGGTVKVPLVIRAPVGSTRRGAQHAQTLEVFFTHVPGLKVVAPSTAYDAKGLLKAAVRDDNPVLIFEHKLLYGSKGARSEKGAVMSAGEVPDEDYIVPIGAGAIRREGRDVTLVGKLLTVYRAIEAAERLAADGIDAEVIDPRSLVPLDRALILESVRKTGRLVVVEEDNQMHGWAAEIVALAAAEAFWWLDAPPVRVSAPDVPPPFAPVLEAEYVPSVERILAAVRALF